MSQSRGGCWCAAFLGPKCPPLSSSAWVSNRSREKRRNEREKRRNEREREAKNNIEREERDRLDILEAHGADAVQTEVFRIRTACPSQNFGPSCVL
jgi:hypothetical protein